MQDTDKLLQCAREWFLIRTRDEEVRDDALTHFWLLARRDESGRAWQQLAHWALKRARSGRPLPGEKAPRGYYSARQALRFQRIGTAYHIPAPEPGPLARAERAEALALVFHLATGRERVVLRALLDGATWRSAAAKVGKPASHAQSVLRTVADRLKRHNAKWAQG